MTQRYWLHTGLIALMVLLACDLTTLHTEGIAGLLIERLPDILPGCMMAHRRSSGISAHDARYGLQRR